MITSQDIKRYMKGQFTQAALGLSRSQAIHTVLERNPSVSFLFPVAMAVGVYVSYTWKRDVQCRAKVNYLINSDCGLATDHLEDGSDFKSTPVAPTPRVTGELVVESTDGSIVFGDFSPVMPVSKIQFGDLDPVLVEQQTLFHNTNETDNDSTTTEYATTDKDSVAADDEIRRRGVGVLDRSSVEVRQHRKVKPNQQMKYMNCVIAECKTKFGVPDLNPANHKAVSRFANNLMVKHGLRPTHVKQYLPIIVNMVFVPTDSDLESASMLTSAGAFENRIEYLVRMVSNGAIPGWR